LSRLHHSDRDDPSELGSPGGVDRPGQPGSGTATSDSLLRELARISRAPSRRARSPELAAGERLGRFHIVSKLGQGGMGAVYEGEDRALGRRVALKVLAHAQAGDDELRRRFLREARSAASVTHPNIAAIHDVGEDQGRSFIVMELVHGRTLRALLAGGPLPVPDALRVAEEMARALSRAHEAGIVHRDLKPDNVMIADDGHAKLLDFGLAKCVDPGAALVTEPAGDCFTTAEEAFVGTRAYMSPEQILGRKVDARSDVFSFGVTLYEMVTGRRPFEGHARADPDPPSRIVAAIPAWLERVISRCLRLDPALRYSGGAELLADLERPRPRRARPLWALAAAGLAGALAAWLGAGGEARLAAPAASPTASAAEAPSAPSPAPAVGSAAPSARSPLPPAGPRASPATKSPGRPASPMPQASTGPSAEAPPVPPKLW
jgi:serine/threonine-protein kinase